MPTAPVWMTQQEMSDAFNVFGCHIRKAVHAIYKNGELLESETKRYIRQDNGINYDVWLTMNNRQPVNLFFSLSPSRGKRAGN